MAQPTIKEMYDQNPELTDPLICDVITSILEIPGVRDAVLVASLHEDLGDGFVSTTQVERVGDIPFQFVWDTLVNKDCDGVVRR